MATKTIKTRLQLIGGNALEWTGKVLYKNEVGVEWGYEVIKEEGQPDRIVNTNELIGIKIGDGVSKWEELEYFGGNDAHVFEVEVTTGADHTQAINAHIQATDPDLELVAGAIAVVKEAIPSSDEKIYTAYVFSHYEERPNEKTDDPDDTIIVPIWKAMDGNVNANNVYFSQNVTVTTSVGNVSASSANPQELQLTGKNLVEVYEYLYRQEDKQITIDGVTAKINLSKTSDTLEVGATYTLPTASVNTTSGKYKEYGGINSENKKIDKDTYLKDVSFDLTLTYTKPGATSAYTLKESKGMKADNTAADTKVTSISAQTVPDSAKPTTMVATAANIVHKFNGTYRHTASDYKPVTNFDNFVKQLNTANAATTKNWAEGAIGVGLKSTASNMAEATYTVKSFRKWYRGGDTKSDFEVATIKGLTASTGAVSKQTFELKAADYAGCSRIVIAIPAAANIKVTKVLLKSSSNADITSEFKQINTTSNVISIGGVNNFDPVPHNVWEYKPAALDSTEVYTITLG